ncbi:MAG TPA: coenzyme F430 synthase [Methanospirillum sp.]|nr:coenzyme F430 synthase [Methanospirillum sp.]
MQILVLDTIHGGKKIGQALLDAGHGVHFVDVYRGDLSFPGSITGGEAEIGHYDLMIYPVHLNPAHPLLRNLSCPAITHHDAVRWILGMNKGDKRSHLSHLIEITGARGKTTTATALAHALSGPGLLHTSRGRVMYPDEIFLGRESITPASLFDAVLEAPDDGWVIAEISLGVCGAGDLAIITSDDNYLVANDMRSAWEIKKGSVLRCRQVLYPSGVMLLHDHGICVGDLVTVEGTRCSYRFNGLSGSFENPLFILEGYRTGLSLAAAGALLLGTKPDRLATFHSIPGRMEIRIEDNRIILDNANSGACLKTTLAAVTFLEGIVPNLRCILVIGQEDRAVCENFPVEDIIVAVMQASPKEVVLVAGDDRLDPGLLEHQCNESGIPCHVVESLEEGLKYARNIPQYPIVVSVKTWR